MNKLELLIENAKIIPEIEAVFSPALTAEQMQRAQVI